MLHIDSDIYRDLTNTEKEVLHFILENEEFVSNTTSRQIAERCNVSKTVIINVTKKMGFEGFSEYKYYLKNQIHKKQKNSTIDFVNDTMDNLSKTLLLNQQNQINDCVDKINKAETIYVLGRGSSKFMASYLTHQLITLNIKASVVSDYNHFGVIAKTMGENDLMIALSLSGETTITVNTAKIASMRKREVISITAFSNNSLAYFSDNNIYFSSTDVDTKTDDTVSRTPMLFVIELLINKVLKAQTDKNTSN